MTWPSGSSSSAARPRPDRCPTPRRGCRAAAKVQEVASKGLAAAKGPLHAIRGTGEAEKLLKNAKTEFFNEHEEIATYNAIQTLAEAVGDKDTAKLARRSGARRSGWPSFLERQISTLAKAVATEEIPAAERRRSSTRRRSAPSRNGGAPRTAAKPAATRSRTSSHERTAPHRPGRRRAPPPAARPRGRRAASAAPSRPPLRCPPRSRETEIVSRHRERAPRQRP